MQNTVFYNSRDSYYKNPFGAVREDNNITLRFKVSAAAGAKNVILVLRKDKLDTAERFIFSLEKTDGNVDTYILNFLVEEKGLYFYRFEVETENGFLFVGKGKDGNAVVGDFLPEWQLTVFDKDFKTPELSGIMYQIFPDRFCNKDNPFPETKNQRFLHNNWYERPHFLQDNPDYEATDFFGGNFKGIKEKLSLLKEMGVTMLYLNPIFESAANHRYNTGNYLAVDPYLGTEEDFKELLSKAEKLGISVILDGVFSHTGSDSVYFNKEGHYDSVGAFQSENSPYSSWYRFSENRDKYECWWGFKTLPNVEETDENYLEFICGEDGVLAHWMKKGVRGWRLDVADELPDVFLERLRERVKIENPDAVIIGEVWEDASTKESYGKRRPYLLGNQLDTVMNYPWRTAILDFVKDADAKVFHERIMEICENYPLPSLNTLMNSLSTHDTPRVINCLGVEKDVPENMKGDYILTPEEYEKGKKLFILASVLQFTLPGIPCIYYGDEVGLTGFKDPWNRRCYPWGYEDNELFDHLKILGRIRTENAENFEKELQFIFAREGMVAYTRGDILVLVNCSDKNVTVPVKTKEILFTTGNCTLEENKIIIPPQTALMMRM